MKAPWHAHSARLFLIVALAYAMSSLSATAQEDDRERPPDDTQDRPVECAEIDFETVPGATAAEGLEIGDQFEPSLGITFALEDGTLPHLAAVGRPVTAFIGRGGDGPLPDQGIGTYFLTDDGVLRGNTSSSLVVRFSQPADSASGVVLDIDYTERFSVEARDASGRVLENLVIAAGDPGTGNAIATPWGFGRDSADVASIRFEGTRQGGRFGLGFDDFVTCSPARASR